MAEGNPDLIAPKFYTVAVEDINASKAAGRKIFVDKEFCEVKFAADRQRVWVGPATDPFHKRRGPDGMDEWVSPAELYAPIYQKFKIDPHNQVVGTPLAELPFLAESKRAELRALNINTAEALAGLDGTPLKALGMHGRDLKNQAQAYIDNAAGTADVVRMAAENEALKDEMKRMADMISELQTAVKRPAAKPAKKKATGPSDFADWDAADIKVWMQDAGADVDPEWDVDELRTAAHDVNQQIKEAKEAA